MRVRDPGAGRFLLPEERTGRGAFLLPGGVLCGRYGFVREERAVMSEREKNFVSCVIYLHNDEDLVKDFLEKVCCVMRENFEKYEIVCVNDGCVDGTIGQIQNYLEESQDSHMLSLINLSYYQGVEAAMNAGRDLAVGDFLFEFDSCLVDYDPKLIMQVYERALEGNDVVAAAPMYHVPLSSRMFYLIYNWGSHTRGKLRQERFRIISRRAVNRVNQLNAYIPYRKALYVNCGLKMDTILYDNKGHKPKLRNREEWGSRSNLAFDTIIIFTDVLERISLFFSVIFFAVLIYMFGNLLYSYFGKDKPVEGWLSTVGLMSIGFFMLFVMLTLIFKYLSVILNMSFRKQRYVVEGVEKLTK